MDIQNQLAAVEAAYVTLNTENAQLRQALRAIRKGLSEGSDGEFRPARRWLDACKIYHGDLSGNRVLELVAKHALRGKLDDPAVFTPAEPPQQETKVSRAPTTEAETVADLRDPDRDATCDWNCVRVFPHDGPCSPDITGPNLEQFLARYYSWCVVGNEARGEWFWLDQIEDAIGRERYRQIMRGDKPDV